MEKLEMGIGGHIATMDDLSCICQATTWLQCQPYCPSPEKGHGLPLEVIVTSCDQSPQAE